MYGNDVSKIPLAAHKTHMTHTFVDESLCWNRIETVVRAIIATSVIAILSIIFLCLYNCDTGAWRLLSWKATEKTFLENYSSEENTEPCVAWEHRDGATWRRSNSHSRHGLGSPGTRLACQCRHSSSHGDVNTFFFSPRIIWVTASLS